MKARLSFIFFVMLMHTAGASGPVGVHLTSESEAESPLKDLVVEEYSRDLSTVYDLDEGTTDTNEYQVWLSEKAHRDHRVLLFEHDHHAELSFSPDEKRIVINHSTGSNESLVHVFNKRDLVHYEEVTKPNIHALLWRYFLQINAPDLIETLGPDASGLRMPMDHHDIELARWAPDGNAILLRFSGHGGDLSAADWFCVLDLKTLKPSLDLNLLNRGAAERRTLAEPLDPQAFGIRIPFVHHDIEITEWAADGSAILLRFGGHVSVPQGVYGWDWFCILDFKSLNLSLDLSRLNRGSVSRRAE